MAAAATTSLFQTFSNGSRVVLNSGNIADLSKLRKKVLLTSSQELVSVVEKTLANGISSQQQTDDTKVVVLRNKALAQRVSEEERLNLQLTIKVFLTEWRGELVREAVMNSLEELGVTSVDTVILSLPPCTSEELTLERIQPLWKVVEELVGEKRVSAVGTADLDKNTLQELYEWATVKPSGNQVNLAHCCTMPEDMVEYAKVVSITLYTHNDERDILPLPLLHECLSGTVQKVEEWSHSWVTRYHSVIKLRGIVSHRGYLIGLHKTEQD